MEIKNIIKKYKEKKNPEGSWDTLIGIIEENLEKQISKKENEIQSKFDNFTKEVMADVSKWTKELQKRAENYIETRRIEIKGDDGYTPVKGIDYEDGKDGYTPKKGVDYFDGKPGEMPKVDYDGIYRTILTRIGDIKDKAEEIVSKINNSKEKILISSIKGLQEELEGIKRAIREGGKGKGQSGGGMGNTQHESKAISSATTSVVTSYPISANGFALWAYYQGQMIARGVGYTVSTDRKTINLLFTPIDNTYIDLIYIR